MATEACRSGHVKLAGANAKASRLVAIGDVYHVGKGSLTLVVKAKALLDRRVGAKRVAEFLEDLTPPEEYERQRQTVAQAILKRDKGAGRPTKRDRRQMERMGRETRVDLPSDDFQ